jgi:hypothetical protein
MNTQRSSAGTDITMARHDGTKELGSNGGVRTREERL